MAEGFLRKNWFLRVFSTDLQKVFLLFGSVQWRIGSTRGRIGESYFGVLSADCSINEVLFLSTVRGSVVLRFLGFL